ncbi:helix-turn-helix transcriptional regulator [Streptomyces sp. SBR177]
MLHVRPRRRKRRTHRARPRPRPPRSRHRPTGGQQGLPLPQPLRPRTPPPAHRPPQGGTGASRGGTGAGGTPAGPRPLRFALAPRTRRNPRRPRTPRPGAGPAGRHPQHRDRPRQGRGPPLARTPSGTSGRRPRRLRHRVPAPHRRRRPPPPPPLERGRALLALSHTERRGRRRASARAAARTAADLFTTHHAHPWAKTAAHALSRLEAGPTGASAHPRLTSAEQRCAELAAAGASNRDIATTLTISVKTVEATLSRVYRKLGLHSRIQLAHTLTPARE